MPTSEPASTRPALHQKIDAMPDEDLALVEHLLERVEMDRLWHETRGDFAQDWAEGRYDRLDQIVQEARAELQRKAA